MWFNFKYRVSEFEREGGVNEFKFALDTDVEQFNEKEKKKKKNQSDILLRIIESLLTYRPLSRCGHLYFTPFQLNVTKLRLDGIIVWWHAQWILGRKKNTSPHSFLFFDFCKSILSWNNISECLPDTSKYFSVILIRPC